LVPEQEFCHHTPKTTIQKVISDKHKNLEYDDNSWCRQPFDLHFVYVIYITTFIMYGILKYDNSGDIIFYIVGKLHH
jgi:hypothetical protein